MNLILLAPDDIAHQGLARVTDPRRLRHLREVHRAAPGDRLTLGVVGGAIGRGELLTLGEREATFALEAFDQAAPPALPVHLVLALPRPRMLARTLEHVTTLGVKRITLLHTRRVEKSYWMSPELEAEKIHHHLVLGLEQARDTRLPEVTLEKGFRPFMEDRLPGLLEGRRGAAGPPRHAQRLPPRLRRAHPAAGGPGGGVHSLGGVRGC